MQSSAPRPPALSLLQSIADRGMDGASHRELFDDGWDATVTSRLLAALRSRGYVHFDTAARRWVATESGARRAGETAGAAPHPLITNR
jgi:hypothetical protein